MTSLLKKYLVRKVRKMDKNDFFQKFGEKILKSSSPSIMKTFKPYFWLAWTIGVFPVQTNCIRWQGMTLHVKKFSLAYLYSSFLLLYKISTMVQFWDFLVRFNSSEQTNQILTDFIAGVLGFFFGFCFGILAHVLAIWKLPSYVNSIDSIEAFDKKYAIEDGDRPFVDKPVKRRHIAFSSVGCLAVVYTPVSMMWHITLEKDSFEFQILPGIYTSNSSFIFPSIILGFLIMELGTGFLYLQLFSVRNLLRDRLTGIIKMVQEKNRKIVITTKGTDPMADSSDWSAIQPSNPFGGQKSWEAIASQYVDFLDIFAKFQNFSGPYFTLLYSTLIIASVCIIYAQLNSESSLTATNGPALKVATVLSLMRIIGLAEAGESFKGTFKKLVKALMISSVQKENESLSAREMEYFKGIVKEVTSLKLVLSANGFFTVSRKNVTSIVSVIITYIIVLLQFSSADKKKIYNSGLGSFGAGGSSGSFFPGNYSDFGDSLPFFYNESYKESPVLHLQM